MDEDKVGLKVEDGEEKKEGDNDDLEVWDEDVHGSNDNEEEDRPKKTKEEISKNLRFVKRVMDSNNLLHLYVNMETLQESKIIIVISNKVVRKAIEILHKLAEKDESRKDKDDDIDDETKEVEINEVAETDNDEIFFDAKNNAPSSSEAAPTVLVMAS